MMWTMQKLLIFSAMITKAWTAAGLGVEGVGMNTGMGFISMATPLPADDYEHVPPAPVPTTAGWKAESHLSPWPGRKKTGNEVGVKAGWRRMAGHSDSGKRGWRWVGAGQAGHDSISEEDSHTHYLLFILEPTGCDIWHLPVSVRHILSGLCALAVVSLAESSAPDSSHAVRAVYSDSCVGLDSQTETLSLQRVTLPQALA